MTKIINILTWIAIGLLVATTVFADSVIIPFSCYPKQLVKKFKQHGKQLDLNGNDRDENSWAFLENKGDSFIIQTYRSVTIDELKLIQELAMEK